MTVTQAALTLTDPRLFETRAYTNGRWIEGKDRFAVHDPATDVLIAQVADMDVADTAAAIDAAFQAQQDWAQRTGKERAKFLRRWFDLMTRNSEDLARILTAENGKPLSEAQGEILYGASYVEWFAEEAKRVYGDVIPGPERDRRVVVLKQPVGVVGSITPWNFPNAMIARKAAPALAAGCTIVARPAEQTPLSALAMAVLADRAGLPPGVFNVIPSQDAAGVGKELCRNPKVRKITFTGSTRVGQIMMEQCAPTIKKLSLELGGNAPFIVFDDADVDAAVEGAIMCKFRNNGQTCVCANRLYVAAPVYDAFAEKLATAVAALRVGNGFDPETTTGPLISEAAVQKVETHIADATARGATVLCGGARLDQPQGTFFAPTVLTGATPDMTVCHEETFGPLAALVPFKTEAEVTALANDSPYGLAAYVFTNDLARSWRVSEALETGMVGVNTGLISTEVAPFGGVKQSGQGREGSKYGIEDYVEIKGITFGGIPGAPVA
ncbi:MAG: NAD-dependent succinate-semialdehyde dehydrogenase [Pseudomonadota bacterium]